MCRMEQVINYSIYYDETLFRNFNTILISLEHSLGSKHVLINLKFMEVQRNISTALFNYQIETPH
jgi:hypothetical protein